MARASRFIEDLIDFHEPGGIQMIDLEGEEQPSITKRQSRLLQDFSEGGLQNVPPHSGEEVERRPPLPQRPRPTSGAKSFSPHFDHFSSASEEAMLKAKEGFIEFSGKGKEGFQRASVSVMGLLKGIPGNEGNEPKSAVPPPVNRDAKPDIRRVTRDVDRGEPTKVPPPVPSKKPMFKLQLLELDRQAIEKQLSEQFSTVKNVSHTAIDNIANATNPLFNGAKDGINTATRNTSELWEASKAKAVTDKMNDDLRDYARSKQGTEGLCRKCQSFSVDSCDTGSEKISDVEIEFETPLERILYHSTWCRLCRFFLQELSRPENDAFKNPQVARHLQDNLKSKTFKEWADKGPCYGDDLWPFGYGKERNEGAFNYLDPVQVSQLYKNHAVVLAKHYIPVMMVVAAAVESNKAYTKADRRRDIDALRKSKKREYAKQTASGNLKHPLECFLKITIRTSKDPLRSGQVQASLMGYGRGFDAPLATLVHFSLRVEAVPRFDSTHTLLRYGRIIDEKQIDLSLGTMWLHDCETRHGSHCSEPSWSSSIQAPPSLRVVDVQNNCVVAVPNLHDFRFVALSYVWGHAEFETLKLGSSNIGDLSEKNGLDKFSHQIGQTIKDAIQVVRGAGERYLWIDALCIIQDIDDDEKHHQIKAMDWIYGKAVYTIVAADAKSSTIGLAGVRAESRTLKQNKVRTNSGAHLLAPIPVPQDLDSTVWNSRAWTFQERLLSRRLLIFQDGQMFWHCRAASAHEDMMANDTGHNIHPIPWLSLRKQHLGNDGKIDGSIMIFPDTTTHIVRSETFKQYAQLVEQYTHRQMTNDGDILNALGGLLHIFRQFFKFPMKYGLPEILFDVALLWQPAERLQPRNTTKNGKSEFPTWSWAGWKGRVRYEEPFYAGIDRNLGTLLRIPLMEGEDRRQERIRPLIRWHFRKYNTNELKPLNKSGWGIPLFSKAANLPDEWDKDPFPSLPDTERVEPFLKASDLPSGILESLEEHCLVFRTSCVSIFRLGIQTPQEGDAAINPSNPPLRYNIINGGSQDVGTVLLDGDGPHHLVEGKHEFVVLSESQYYGLDFEPGMVDGYPLYNVMLIEWDASGTIARRLGLGRVNKMDWQRADPKPKIICLG